MNRLYGIMKKIVFIIIFLFLTISFFSLLICFVVPPIDKNESTKLANDSYRTVEISLMENENISEAHVISDEDDFGPHLIIDIKLNNGGRVILDNVNWNLSGKNIAVWCIGNYSIDGTYYKKGFFNKIADRASYESLRCDVLSDSLDIKLETAFDVVNNYSMILDYIESRKRENNLKNEKSLFFSTRKYDSWIYLDYFPNSHINSLYENWNRWH